MMMIIGRETLHSNPTVQVPPWDDPTDHIHSPNSVFFDELEMAGYDDVSEDGLPVDAFSCDHFRMYEFKVRRCARGRSHDWTECPYAHPGEKARRRDPRKFHYSGVPCPEFRKGTCQRGDTCELAHGVFECWLHPSRYRTQPCKDGVCCRRRICFFAHTPDQLRLLPPSPTGQLGLSQLGVDSYDGSPSRLGGVDSPTSTLYRSPSSPPLSPIGACSVSELSSGVRNLQIGNGNGNGNGGRFSPRNMSNLRLGLGFTSLPVTPSRDSVRNCVNSFDIWDQGCGGGGGSTMEEPIMERVESGKQIRAKIYAKLSRENSLGGRVDSDV